MNGGLDERERRRALGTRTPASCDVLRLLVVTLGMRAHSIRGIALMQVREYSGQRASRASARLSSAIQPQSGFHFRTDGFV